MLTQFAASLVDGLLIGFVYGVAAMGLTLIWGVVKIINLAHGAILALAMFGLYFLASWAGLNPYVALPLVFAVNMMIIGTATTIFTTSPYSVTFDAGRVSAGFITVPGTRIVATVAAIIVTGALYVFLYRSRTGKAIRAVANNRDAAELMGIPSGRILALSFGLGTMLAAVAGGLIATFFPFTILSGDAYQLKSFVIVVLGGLGNPLGALAGGLILGSLEGLVQVFTSASWVPVIEFGLFVIILLVRPNGIFAGRG